MPLFLVFKQKTAYEMRISDGSSDVCSSDLPDTLLAVIKRQGPRHRGHAALRGNIAGIARETQFGTDAGHIDDRAITALHHMRQRDRKSVVKGKSVSVRVDLGGRRIIPNTH